MLADLVAASKLAEMAAQGANLTCTLRVAELPRLAAIAMPGPGREAPQLQVRVNFAAGPEGFPVVRIETRGAVSLACQRCLGPVDWPLDIDVSLTAVADDAGAAELASPFDSILLDKDGALPLKAVVEDEILAALPIAPLHQDQTECSRVTGGRERPPETRGQRMHRPFAGLAGLMRPSGRDDDTD